MRISGAVRVGGWVVGVGVEVVVLVLVVVEGVRGEWGVEVGVVGDGVVVVWGLLLLLVVVCRVWCGGGGVVRVLSGEELVDR